MLCLEHKFLRNIITISYLVHHNYLSAIIMIRKEIMYVFSELFVPNWPISLIVLMANGVFFSLIYKHQQDCVRNVDVSTSMTSIPDLEFRC